VTGNRGFLLAGQLVAAVLAVSVVVMTAASRGTVGGAGGAREADRLNGQGVEAYDAGDFDGAGALFERALDLDPENTAVRQNLALAVFAQAVAKVSRDGDVVYDESAVRLMQTASSLDPERAEIHAALGNLCFMASRIDESRSELAEAVRLDPRDAQSLFLLGEIAHREGDVSEALAKWREAAGIEPENELFRQRLDQAEKESDVESRFARRNHSHFALRYDVDPAGIQSAADEMLTVLEDAYGQVAHELGLRPTSTISVVVYEEEDFRAVTGLHDWARGVYDGRIRVPYGVLQLGAASMRQVCYHEYTHAAIYEASRGRCPVWLNEGLAQLMSGEWDPDDAAFLSGAMTSSELVPLAGLETSFVEESDPIVVRVMYGEAYVAARYLVERYGRFAMGQALAALGDGRPMSRVLDEVFSTGYDELDVQMRRRIEWGDYKL
jgi:Tfp pilus assembly protein PilF